MDIGKIIKYVYVIYVTAMALIIAAMLPTRIADAKVKVINAQRDADIAIIEAQVDADMQEQTLTQK